MNKGILAALACAATMACAGSASASLYYDPTNGGTIYNPPFDFGVYSTPEQWDFWTVNDPNAIMTLQAPNEVGVYVQHFGSSTVTDIGNPTYSWVVNSQPGHLSITVRGPVSYDVCDQTGPVGDICAIDYVIWGNGTHLLISSTVANPGLQWSDTPLAVPEPATWATMIVGMFGLGAMLRRKGHDVKGKMATKAKCGA